ncbi:MAG: Pr6Pr family membrane protein [Christensenellales bacterium]|jgi:hypothetical protein
MPVKGQCRLTGSILFKALIVALGVLGQRISFMRAGFRLGGHLLYYTNITNILAILLSFGWLVVLCRMRLAGQAPVFPRRAGTVRFAMATGILLTFAGFSMLLLPSIPRQYMFSAENILVHYLVPLMTVLDYLLFDEGLHEGQPRLGWGLVLPLAYMVLTLVLIGAGHRYDRGAAAPYFFLDAEKNGWFTLSSGRLGVCWWILLLFLMQAMLSAVVKGLKERVLRRREVPKC